MPQHLLLRSCLRQMQLLVTHWQQYCFSYRLQNKRMCYTRKQGSDRTEMNHLLPESDVIWAGWPMLHARAEPGEVCGCLGPGSTWEVSSQQPTCLFLDLTEHTEESGLHPMAIQSMLSVREATEEHVREREVILSVRIKSLHIESASSPENPLGRYSTIAFHMNSICAKFK